MVREACAGRRAPGRAGGGGPRARLCRSARGRRGGERRGDGVLIGAAAVPACVGLLAVDGRPAAVVSRLATAPQLTSNPLSALEMRIAASGKAALALTMLGPEACPPGRSS